MEFIFIIIIVGSLALGFWSRSQQVKINESKDRVIEFWNRVAAQPEPKPKKKKRKKKKKKVEGQDPIKKEAKNMLVSFGYSATEANTMLDGIVADSPQNYVSKAMLKVKI